MQEWHQVRRGNGARLATPCSRGGLESQADARGKKSLISRAWERLKLDSVGVGLMTEGLLSVGLMTVGLMTVGLTTVGCAPKCEGLYLGNSTDAPLIGQSWPYGDGTAAGVWSLNLVPNPSGTNCVDLSSGSYPAEAYRYTLEFSTGASPRETRLYLEGIPFADGAYTDESAEYQLEDALTYESAERVASDRPEGVVHYRIEGSARLEANTRAGALVWTGYERIVVLESEDPTLQTGCTYYYDVTGTKVCDE